MKRNGSGAALWTFAAAANLSALWALTSCAAIDRSAPSPSGGGTANGGGDGGGALGSAGGRSSSAGSDGAVAGNTGDTGGSGGSGGASGGAGAGGPSTSGTGSTTAQSGGAAGLDDSLGEGGAFDGTELVNDLSDGYYSLSASVTKSGVGNCYISVKDYGDGPERMTSLPVTAQPATIVVRGVHVVGGQATIGSYNDADGTR